MRYWDEMKKGFYFGETKGHVQFSACCQKSRGGFLVKYVKKRRCLLAPTGSLGTYGNMYIFAEFCARICQLLCCKRVSIQQYQMLTRGRLAKEWLTSLRQILGLRIFFRGIWSLLSETIKMDKFLFFVAGFIGGVGFLPTREFWLRLKYETR